MELGQKIILLEDGGIVMTKQCNSFWLYIANGNELRFRISGEDYLIYKGRVFQQVLRVRDEFMQKLLYGRSIIDINKILETI